MNAFLSKLDVLHRNKPLGSDSSQPFEYHDRPDWVVGKNGKKMEIEGKASIKNDFREYLTNFSCWN